MNNGEKYKEDLLREYISPEKSEEAPDGFTSRVMSRIESETVTNSITVRAGKRSLVPYVSVAVTILFVAAAFIIPGNQTDSMAQPFLNIIKNIKLSMPEVNLSSIREFSLPSVITYAFTGIFVLVLVDKALYGIFKREK